MRAAQAHDFPTEIATLGAPTITSPIPYCRFIEDSGRVLHSQDAQAVEEAIQRGERPARFEIAGPRAQIYFNPPDLKVGIVTCGGLCPGLNDVIRAIVNELYFMYGVRRIKGIRNGYAGLNPAYKLPMLDLTPEVVSEIHEKGGTFLGTSRGPQPMDVMVDTLYREEIRVLFVIGGDGTQRGAAALAAEIHRRGLKIGIIGVPKTIDNDINLVSRTFGFETAVSKAVESIRCAHMEAKAAPNGIGIVKLMGRHAGFVAASAALAQPDANFVFIPEVPFRLEGAGGFFEVLEARMQLKRHALIVIAEGAGQHLFDQEDAQGRDASGNLKLGDVGVLLKQRIGAHFQRRGLECNIKYIDPSYIIRSVPATPNDGIFCVFLGQHAAHAGMAGKTDMLISSWNGAFIHLPIAAAIAGRRQVDPQGILWSSVLESTGQPLSMFGD
ncbi:ATP-dependent 6-phosphofructokinase [Myxococcota bacterium]|nr:ATP-dependent 6-phosphofructokinase [Myxococcota bacterium]MBU1431527.1 ATP-dependent 6-phosphofructokinase [Myxococcota bacterium]MBU1899624.1 ATP-dependent 6-phosphofructokinase [Myxococcota bacterium]